MSLNASHAQPATSRSFGRALRRPPAPESGERFTDDFRLFALTFAGGFLFMTVYLA